MSNLTPPEIVDQILDHLHADRTALETCALVCKDWLPTSRFHIFRSLRLHSNNIDAFFAITSSPNCTLLGHVQHLELIEGRGRFAYEKKWLNRGLPFLKAFYPESVKSLMIEELDWDGLSMESREVLLSTFSKLQTLSIYYSRFATFGQLANLLCKSPKLAELHLYAVRCMEGTAPPVSLLQQCPLSALCKLEVHTGPVSPLLPWLLTSDPVPQLSDVDFGCVVDEDDIRVTKAFLEALGSSVEHLKFCFGVVDESNKDSFCKNMDLTQNNGIRSIQFNSVALYATLQAMSFAQSIPLLFSRLGSWCMEEIGFAFLVDSAENLGALDWDMMACLFAQPQFSTLRRIRVMVHGRIIDKDEAANLIRAKLPACEARGILEFC